MNPVEQKKAAKRFVAHWKEMPCVEEEHSRSFWIELVGDVLGIANPTHALEFERKVKGRKIDVFYEDMGILIEMKGRGISLDKASERSKKAGEETPYQQAKWYADNLPYSIRPRWIITCNFDEFRIYDQDKAKQEEYVSFTLDELPAQLHLLSIFTNKSNSRIEREKELSVKAGALVGKLYSELSQQYKNIDTDLNEQRSLNILIVRLVFLLYAEDAGLLHEKDALLNYLREFESWQMRQAIIDLFAVLDTPDGQNGTENERSPYLSEKLSAFPYVNGGLFGNDDIIIPQFTDEIRIDLLIEASEGFNWAEINPTIFGAAFESTLNPETRRAGGMHYTSIENIHKVIDPLFLDDLKAELAEIEGVKVEKTRVAKLRAFQKRLAGITVFDPACGSGNFLTESYLSLRKLENRVIENLQGDQKSMDLGGDIGPIKVSIGQFYGIEINDFAVSVAKTALWIAEEQMMEATQEIVEQVLDFLPLKSNGNIHEGNALRMDWNDVLPAEKCSFICGNPPFVGARMMDATQKSDLKTVLSEVRNNHDIDYVGGWYAKCADMMDANPGMKAALVSTNSICQGAQVGNLWSYLIARRNLCIDFAYRSFIWNSEANDKAHVHCVIVGFTKENRNAKRLFAKDGEAIECENINGYLMSAPSVFVEDRKEPLCDVPKMANGNQPRDGGFFVLKPEERDSLVASEPEIARFIRPYIGSEEFIKRKDRYCLWLEGVSQEEIDASPVLRERVNAVRDFRLASKAKTTNGYAKTPALFAQRPQKQGVDFLLLPRVSSERRHYLPIGYMDKTVVASDAAQVIPDATLYHYGVLQSQAHNAWMRTVAGRLKSDYRYSKEIVYNCFVWPEPTDKQRAEIECCAQAVLDARAAHPGSTLADLYDPDKMPFDLLAAHQALDAAVEAAYGVDFKGNEEKIVAHLFKLYAQKVSKQ